MTEEPTGEEAARPDEAEGPAEPEITPEDLVALLGSLPERLADLVSAYGEERLRYRHGPAFPTVGEVVGHLAASGEALEGLLTAVCLDTGDEPRLDGILRAPTPPALGRPLAEVLEGARRVRRRSVDLLRGLPAEGWGRTVNDPEHGEIGLEEVVRLVLRHELGHLVQLRNLAAFFPEASDLGPAQPVAGGRGD